LSKPWWDRPSVAAFRALAQHFITLVDERDSYPSATFLHHVHSALPRLYSCGLSLPEKPESAYEDDDDAELETSEPDTSCMNYSGVRFTPA
jgi:Domain of unknown function (DUF5063)